MAADEGPKFLYLYGPRGAGLSHLLEAYLPGTAAALYPVPIYQPGVKRYAVDDIDALDEGYARQLLQLQTLSMLILTHVWFVPAGCPRRNLSFPPASSTAFWAASAMR